MFQELHLTLLNCPIYAWTEQIHQSRVGRGLRNSIGAGRFWFRSSQVRIPGVQEIRSSASSVRKSLLIHSREN